MAVLGLPERVGGVPTSTLLIGAGALGVGFLVFRSFSRPKPAASSTSAGRTPESQFGLGYAQGLQAAQVNAPAPAPTAPPTAGKPTITVGNSGGRGVPIFSYDMAHQGVIGVVPDGTTLPLLGTAVGFLGDPGYLVQWSGGTGFVTGGNVIATIPQPSVDQRLGTGGPARKFHSGSRSAVHMSYFHPDIKQKVLYPQFVRARGGASAHHSEVHRVARQSGVHPARLLALNPHSTGLIRVR